MSPAPTPLGCFTVTGHASEVDAFRRATGLSTPDGAVLPLTFPMRWLAAPEVKDAVGAMVPHDVALVHEAQSFDYERPLRVGTAYTLTLRAHREADPDRVVLHGAIATGDCEPVARLETVLRLFPLGQPDGGLKA